MSTSVKAVAKRLVAGRFSATEQFLEYTDPEELYRLGELLSENDAPDTSHEGRSKRAFYAHIERYQSMMAESGESSIRVDNSAMAEISQYINLVVRMKGHEMAVSALMNGSLPQVRGIHPYVYQYDTISGTLYTKPRMKGVVDQAIIEAAENYIEYIRRFH